jgi:hypothetical protein
MRHSPSFSEIAAEILEIRCSRNLVLEARPAFCQLYLRQARFLAGLEEHFLEPIMSPCEDGLGHVDTLKPVME